MNLNRLCALLYTLCNKQQPVARLKKGQFIENIKKQKES